LRFTGGVNSSDPLIDQSSSTRITQWRWGVLSRTFIFIEGCMM
jgi:hypothetical protein